MIEEDRQTGYSNTLLSYFSSQAIAAGHQLCVVNADQDVDLKTQLPGWAARSTAEPDASAGVQTAATSDPMKIAWRYQNLPRVDSDDDARHSKHGSSPAEASEVPFCERFDLMLRIQPTAVDQAQVEVLDSGRLLCMASDTKYGGDMYQCLLDHIAALIDNGFSSLKPTAPGAVRNILRIEIGSLGSGFWQGSDSLSILKFLHRLRGLLRYSYAVCMLSFPVHLYEDTGVRLPVVRRIEHLCDAVVELESFEGTYAKPSDIVLRQAKSGTATMQEYHGFVHIHKLPRLNSLTASMGRLSLLHSGGGSANNLAFRLRRKKFSIETYHLPIEGGVSERRVPAKDDPKAMRPGMGCGSTPGRTDPL
ncbi:Elongator subunit elp4, partial [Coemansia sp. RSA 2706]